jgi:hypothetical protein
MSTPYERRREGVLADKRREKKPRKKREEVEKRSATYGERRRLHRRREITKVTLRSDFKQAKVPWIELWGM